MDHYSEYFDRVRWSRSEKLHVWVASKIVTELNKYANIKGKRILEIGVGTGRIAKALQGYGVLYLGIEPNTKLAEFSRLGGYDVLEEELPNLSKNFQDKFDAVISLHVLEHAPTYLDARSWTKEMLRVTKPGGFVLIAAPDIRDYGNYFYDSDWSHGYPTTPTRISQIFNDLGAEVKFSGCLNLGSTSKITAALAQILNILIPTRPIDYISRLLVKRPLATGLKIALIWGLSIVVAKKPQQ